MTDELKKPPTKSPTAVRDALMFLAHPDYYENESEEDFTSRKNLLEAYTKEFVRQGLTLDDLVMAEMGITKPTGASPLLNTLIGRL